MKDPVDRVLHAGVSLAALALLIARAGAQAPVPVREEPRHKVVLENAYIRLFDVWLPPGEVTLYHTHTLPSVVVELSRSRIVSQEWGKAAPAPRDVAPGETRYAPYDVQPLTHRVSNAGDTPFHVMDIELLQPGASLAPPGLLPQPQVKFSWVHRSVRVYSVHLASMDRCSIPPNPCAHLLIAASGGVRLEESPTHNSVLKPGEYRFFPPQAGFSAGVPPGSRDPAECVLLELAGTEPGARVLPDLSHLGAGRAEKLDLYLPAPLPTAAPAVVWIHGGSFTGGDKARGTEKNLGTHLSAAGYVVASVNYRLGDGAWPQNIRDCKNAVRFLRTHAAEYRLDPARIAVAGGSAGAYLALMVGFTADDAPFDPGAVYPGISDHVRAVVDFYGPSDT